MSHKGAYFMNKETIGTVISVKKQWWLKINTKPIRTNALNDSIFPHIIKVQYSVNSKNYTKIKWIKAGMPVPSLGSSLKILFSSEKPAKSKIIL